MTKPTTLREALQQTTGALSNASIEAPEREARHVLVEACAIPTEHLIAWPDKRLTAEQSARLAEFTARRCREEPLSRIVGWREFYGRKFELSSETLDPRPDTETVIDLTLEIIDAEGGRERPLRVLDIGTGTGALLVTLLSELPFASGIATDISGDALATATRNANRHGVGDRAAFMQTSSLDGIDGPFDLLVSNPPYIPSADIAHLSTAVRVFDPVAALDGGADGLDIYKAICRNVPNVVPSGWVVFEVGAGQADDVSGLLEAALGNGGPASVQTRKDLSGHIRCVAGATHC